MLEPVLSFRASLLAFERQAEELLDAGAEPDAPADMYSGQSATMSMLVSSSQPAQAGVQVALVDTLADRGASVESLGAGTGPAR